jgi:putative hydrolase
VSDNLFDRLFELFQTTDSVNWGLAEEVTKSVAGTQEPIEPRLAEEYEELALAAHLRLADIGLVDIGAASVVPHPIDRASWARQNPRSFAYLLEPLAVAMRDGLTKGTDASTAAMGPLGPALVGLQAGAMVGLMSERAMGLFDLPLPALDATGAYLLVTNVEAFALDNGLDAKQVRLWATLRELLHHEVTHRDTVRDRLNTDVAKALAGLDFDASRLTEILGDMQDPAGIESALSNTGGLAALLGGEGASAAATGLQATAAFIEGYGIFSVRRAGAGMLIDLVGIEGAHRRHRADSSQVSDQLRQLLGLEFDRSKPDQAVEFCVNVEKRWGPPALQTIWETARNLPTPEELSDVVGWAARVLLA